MKTQVTLLRRDGKGLVGTYENAEHHADAIIPFINKLKNIVGKIGFKAWQQGHNIHLLVRSDDVKFALRAYTRDGEYVGVRLSLRVSKSVEIPLIDIEDTAEIDQFIWLLENIASSPKGDLRAIHCNH